MHKPVFAVGKMTGYILYCIAMLAVCLGIAEILLRMGYFQPSFEQVALDIVLDDRLLYRVKPNCRPHINNFGFHDKDFKFEKGGRKRILFIGDSFVMDPYVDKSETAAAQIEKELGPSYEIYNMGVIGYGPDQSLKQFLEPGLKFDPDILLLGIFPTNDYNDILKNRLFIAENGSDGPRLKEYAPNLVTEKIPRIKLVYLFQWLRFKWDNVPDAYEDLFDPLFRDYYDFGFMEDLSSNASRGKLMVMRALFRAFKAVAEEKNIPFGVVIFPSYENIQDDAFLKAMGFDQSQYFVNERLTEDLLKIESIPFVSLREPFLTAQKENDLYNADDLHMSAEGNRVAARVILAWLRKTLLA